MKNTMKKPINIPISKLRPFEGHPFKVKDDDEMNTLIESIQTQGVLSPLIVRPIENTDEYEVISGHRRLHAAQKAGIVEIPALIYALDRDSAAIVVVDSNLHREHILPSEKAFAYKLKLDAMRRQGFRSDLTSDQVGRKLETADIIAQQSDDSKTQVRRYIRLTHLIPELLDLMDEGKIALSVGVELSYLDDQSQYDVLEQCEQNDCTPSYSQAFRMHKADREGLLTKAVIQDIMCEEKANQKETIKVSAERLRAVLPKGMDSQKTEDFIIRACEHYRKYLIRQRNRDER
ncbi:MAG: ParB/RepB/Spo0J family partition protein [Clostridia bacterium]|nr:ParB/RepB/Spo0J family partition protein [Clostridia bacterium]